MTLGNLRSFTFKELQYATDNFSSKNILAAGGFGNIYKGKLGDGTIVAVKRLKDINGTDGESQFRTELELISLEVHRNLLPLIGYCAIPIKRLLVYPFMSNGSVASRLKDVCIVGVARTPLSGFLGSLSSLLATKLGSIAIESALKRANVDPSLVQEVYFGNVLGANLGQGPARQAALGVGFPNTLVSTSINKVCASGMKATMLAAQSIQLGINHIVVSGGMESMSNIPINNNIKHWGH